MVESLDGIDALESDWRSLTPPHAAPFVTFAWNRAWYRRYRDSMDRPLVFQVLEGGETVAILPCYQRSRVVRLAGDAVCDYQDILAKDAKSVEIGVAAATGWVRKQPKQCHFFFERLSSEGLLHGALVDRRTPVEGASIFVRRHAPCPCVDLQGGLEAYLASLPRKIRGDLRRALNRLEREAPSARVVISRDREIGTEDVAKAAAFHVEHFRNHGASPLADERLVGLLAEVAEDPDVGLRLSSFADGNDTLAVDFGFARGGRYFGYLTGFDPAYRKLAPGKCLLLSRIDAWVEEDGVEILDFLAGGETYKKGFTGGEGYRVDSVRLLPDSLRHRLLRHAFEFDKGARTIAKALLSKAGLLER
ncbi:MAG: GNAT family N-acetyltransferase [Verrucomicrobiales bacterium]